MKKEYRFQFLLFILMAVLISIISTKIYFRLDMSKGKTYTLSNYTKNLLKNLDSSAKVTWFKSSNVDLFFPSLKYLNDMLLEYALYSNEKFSVSVKNTSSLSNEAVKQIGIIPREVEAQDNAVKIVHKLYSGLMIEYMGQTRVIPFIDDIDTLEYDLARFILSMRDDAIGNTQSGTIALIADPALLENDYSYVIPWLEYAGFNVLPLELPVLNIPAELPLLVIGSDYIDYSSAAAIDMFLQKEGRAVFFVSGNKVDVKGSWKAKPKVKDFLLDVLSHHGFYVNANMALDLINNFRITMSSIDNRGTQLINYPYWIQLPLNGIDKDHPIFAAYRPLVSFWPSSIDTDLNKNSSITPFAFTGKNSLTVFESYSTDPLENHFKKFQDASFKPSVIVAGQTKPSRVLVISDEYMISKAIDYTASLYNMDFMVNCVEYICLKDNLLLLKNKKHSPPSFKQFEDRDEMFNLVFKARLISLIFLPIFIFALGVYIFIKQGRVK
ncbi:MULTISPECIES: GldG family protein [unclassified Treponema]|uniref:GldG family protein n=1 Tax=unclassified Treponema TaxID=2638727 RepID=UPI0020A34850|nr:MULTISPECIES: GldG family protein [unclassified Treponema]UTC67667.1 GldG family protein [Treponema sp. OMZ 789]UTC70395.1 GldG family protein [Treponema sp. OMZ 790]UTC73109.1 GldG family protein [Treponema sp. OMZ 791]